MDAPAAISFRSLLPELSPIVADARPNVLVVGVGHSGTSVVTRMLAALGWQAADADEEFAECVPMREANDYALVHGQLPESAREYAGRLFARRPWVAKDPRLCVTLPLWWPLLRVSEPVVVNLEKSREKVEESYLRRGAARRGNDVTMRWVRGSRRYTIGELYDQLQHSLAHWPFPVMRLQYEQVMAACSLFRPRQA